MDELSQFRINPESIAARSLTRGRWFDCLTAVLLWLLVVVVYIPSLWCGFIWDDDSYVTDNAVIREADGLRRIWFEPLSTPQYYPLVHSTFWIEYHLWGLKPAGFHAVNVLLHAATCIVIWISLRTLGIPGAWLAAAIFGVHPVHVESVAWITERKNVLSAFLYVTALLTVLPCLNLDVRSSPQKFPLGRYLLALLFFLGALLGKSVTCSLPATCLLLIYWKRGRVSLREVALMFPWFALGLGAAMHTAWLERNHVGATGSVFSWTLLERCWIAGHAVWFYLEKLFWPHPLVFFYPRWVINTQLPAGWIGPIAAALLPLGLWLAGGRIGRGPLIAALYFGGTLLPALGFVNVYPMRYSFVADHFQYLASLGPIVLFSASIAYALSRSSAKNLWQPIVSATILLPLCVLTWQQLAIYQNLETLWTDVLLKNPRNFVAHARLGAVRTDQGRYDDAAHHFRESLRWQTDDTESHMTLRMLGNCLSRQGQFDQAEECLNEALRSRPGDWSTIYGLATLAARQQQHAKAIEFYRRALNVDGKKPLPKASEVIVRMNLGNSLAAIGELRAAAEEYQTILRLQPGQVDAIVNLANLYARQGLYTEAERLYLDALQRQPKHQQALANLAKVRAAMSK